MPRIMGAWTVGLATDALGSMTERLMVSGAKDLAAIVLLTLGGDGAEKGHGEKAGHG
jgi:hypothetical protein